MKQIRTFSMAKEVVGKNAICSIPLRPSGELKVEVKVLDFKHTFGRPTFLVEPIRGSGQTWSRKLATA